MKKFNAFAFVFIILLLVYLNSVFLLQDEPQISDVEELVNHEVVSPQKLVDDTWDSIQDNYFDSSLNHQKWSKWKYHYRNKIKTEDDAKVAIETMLASLDDPYSRFMTKEDFLDQNTSIKSKITGIGVNITSVSGKIKVVNVVENTPAQFSNVLPNDIILSVDGKDVNGLSLNEVATLVKGPENSFVKLTLLRNNDKLVKNIMRKEIKIKTVKSSIDKNIGYIQIKTFIGSSTPNEFLDALEKTKDTDALILDLRGNTGGLLPNAVFIANLFIPKGNIVSIVGRNGYKYDIDAEDTQFAVNKPMVVLVDGTSASASEILSGALKDYHKAVLVGSRTFGKGMVQKIIPLPNETGMNLTIAKYLTPSGKDINKIGIKPDVNVEYSIKDMNNKVDTQLDTAKNILNKMLVNAN